MEVREGMRRHEVFISRVELGEQIDPIQRGITALEPLSELLTLARDAFLLKKAALASTKAVLERVSRA